MTDAELFQLLRPLVMTVTGCPQIILAAQNSQAPKGEYGSIQIRYQNDERGHGIIHSRNVPGDQIEFNVKPQRIMTCVAEFYRGNAKLYAERMQAMQRRDDVIWPLYKSGISLVDVRAVSDLTALQSSNWEQRARVEFVLWLQGESKYIENQIKGAYIIADNEKGKTLQMDAIPEEVARELLTPMFVNTWADRIYEDSRLGA